MSTSIPAPGAHDSIDLDTVDAWWRAANYLSVGQIYLMDNPLLREPLRPEHIKPRLLGHWGTSPALNLVWAHLNRIIRERDVDALYICGPGHGGPAMVANTYLDGTYSELFPDIAADRAGLGALFRQFSFPGGIPSHAAPETPGSINEGGELGYSLMHAYGAALDNPDLVVACVIGDGEAETGPLATSWHANKLIDARTDGAVLPILNLNGYKIANPTILARIGEGELVSLLRGYGHEPILVSGGFDGEDPFVVHGRMSAALDTAFDAIHTAQVAARERGSTDRPRWPMIVLRTPKGWTGPREVDGVKIEGTFHAHQVPLDGTKTNDDHRRQLEEWMRSYRPDELFDDEGRLVDAVAALRPAGKKRMSATPHANGGDLLHPLSLPEWQDFGVDSAGHTGLSEPTRQLGRWLARLIELNPETFRLFGPDETVSNRLDAVFEVTDRVWAAELVDTDEHLTRGGRVTEMLSEHVMQGMLEGYLLTGRHGLFNTYEAFVHIVDSMFNQHAKWIESASAVPWRRPIASLNYLLSSHVWRQDHNGFSHQDPGFLNVVINKRADLVRIYLPSDANTLIATAHHVFQTTDRINVVVCGKQEQPTWLSTEEAAEHSLRGIGVWEWAGNGDQRDPDVVLACAGDVPTLEAVAAAQLLRQRVPHLSVRVVNVLDLMRLQSADQHPHGLEDAAFDALFTTDKPVIFAFHGYPMLVHQLTYKRTNHTNIHVRGFAERGTTTTPFDMVHLNDLDRFRLALDVIHRVPGLAEEQTELAEELHRSRDAARTYAYEHGEDPADISGWSFER